MNKKPVHEKNVVRSRKNWLMFGGGFFICACIAVIGGLGILIFRPALFNPLMPVYEYEIVPSAHEGYSRQTLTRGGITFVSDYEEFGFSTGGNDHQIGQTPMSGHVIEIAGQNDYVVLFDFMSPLGVFRNSQIPPLDWRTINFTEMNLYPNDVSTMATPTAPKTSTDISLIEAAFFPFLNENPNSFPDQTHELHKSYALNLYSEELQGMWYTLGVFVDQSGQVYVAENLLSTKWLPADSTFSEWVISK